MSKHALTSHIVSNCICSTTRMSLLPYTRSSLSLWLMVARFVPGSSRFELVCATMLMTTMSTVYGAIVKTISQSSILRSFRFPKNIDRDRTRQTTMATANAYHIQLSSLKRRPILPMHCLYYIIDVGSLKNVRIRCRGSRLTACLSCKSSKKRPGTGERVRGKTTA